jgi:transposase-like protein
MPSLSSLFPPPVIRHPRCPNCSTPMELARIEPDNRGFDRQTFDCSNCEHSESWVFKGVGKK